MAERQIDRDTVLRILLEGEVIEEYPDDFPFPSALILGWHGERPLHIVAAWNEKLGVGYLITIYEPGLDYFEIDFRTRKQK